MKMNSILIILSIGLSFGCEHSNANNTYSEIKEKKKEIDSVNEISEVFNIILEYPQIKEYFHFESNTKFYILNNDILRNFEINFDSDRYALINNIDGKNNYIEFTNFTHKNLEYEIGLEIPNEGVKSRLKVCKVENKWSVVDFIIFER